MPTKQLMWEGAARLDRALDRKRVSNTALAKELGVTDATVSRYRSGERAPDPDTLAKICRVAGISADHVLGVSVEKGSAGRDAFEERLRSLSTDEKLALVARLAAEASRPPA